MTFTHANLWENLETVLSKRLSLAGSWKSFLGLLIDLKPKEYWQALLSVDVVIEKAEIADWLNGLITTSPLPPATTALWIGIAELYDDGSEVYAYYLHGADIYDKDDTGWASDPSYEPEEKYIIPDVLNEIREIIKADTGDYAILDWILTLAYSSFLFTEIIKNSLNKELFLKNTDKLHVSLGYNGGDFVNLPPVM